MNLMAWAAFCSVAAHALHGQESAADLGIGQADLTQQAQIGHRAGGDEVETVPIALDQSLLLGAGVDGLDAGESQFSDNLVEPVDPLVQGVQQNDLQLGHQNFQGQAGETGAGTHIDEGLALEIGAIEQGGAVQHVEFCHLIGVGDGGQIHDLIFLDEHPAVALQKLGSIFRNLIQQIQLRKAVFDDFFQEGDLLFLGS